MSKHINDNCSILKYDHFYRKVLFTRYRVSFCSTDYKGITRVFGRPLLEKVCGCIYSVDSFFPNPCAPPPPPLIRNTIRITQWVVYLREWFFLNFSFWKGGFINCFKSVRNDKLLALSKFKPTPDGKSIGLKNVEGEEGNGGSHLLFPQCFIWPSSSWSLEVGIGWCVVHI